METEEDLTSLDADTESPEIISVPSCSSSLSPTSTISSQDKPEMLTSLLLQIQQFHTAETQKLHEKNNKWKAKCIKLAEVANTNANIAKRYYKHNKRLVIKVNELEHQLKAFQSQSHLVGIRSENSKQAHPPVKEPPGAELSNKPSNQEKVLRNHDLQHEAQSIVSSKPLSKLTSKKTRKKVRYSEISPDAMRTKQSSEVTAHVVPEMAKIGPFDRQKLNYIQVIGTPQVARILAPDTCPSPAIPSPSCKMNPNSGATPSGHDKTNPSTARPVPWIEDTGHAFTIPETLGMAVGDVTTSVIDLTDENLCAPAYESTPVWEKRNISSVLESSKNRGEDRFIQDLSMKKLFPETPDGQKLLVTTIPRSESQFPVDLYNTQVKSPTFCGGESLLTTPEIADSSTRHRNKVTVCKNEPVPFRGDNYDLCNQDETCESEDSILLLGQRAMVSATKTGDSQVVSRSKSDQDDQREEIVTSRDSKKKSAEVRNETTPAKDLRTSTFKKRRHHPGDSSDSFGEETVLPDTAELGKENSPEGLDDLSSRTSPNLFSGEKQREKDLNCLEKSAVTKEKVIGQKSLKQSKLSKSMFKASANRPLSLLQKYNGGDAADTNVESQLDTYLNQAIKLSLVEQKKSAHGGTQRTNKSGFKRRRVEGAVSPSKDASVGFKFPSIPHQKKQRQLVSPTPNTEHLPHSSEFTSTPQNLNGSIDPLMDLTRLESDGASSPREMDLSREEGYPRSGRGDYPGQEAEFEGDEGNDSCVDLFQEDEEDYEDEEVIDEEAVEGVEMEEEEEDEEAGDEGVDEDSGEEMDRSVDRLDVTGYINNFDKVPEKNEQLNFKYTEVVRKRDERQKLKGFGCKECDRFYGNLKLTDAEREVRMKECSRHRAQFSPPNTPDHYWSIGFPDTQTCIQRGYINKGGNSPDRRVRKKNKYKVRRILGKEEGNEMDG
ncbi:uncharacterized protein [Asterias amurensis]|uniref:uncharacterized protein n=1 Tax=Asterias amurensis TaxID=7602 RepID=UPI003AB25A95